MKCLDGIPETLYKYRRWDDPYHQRLLTHQEVFLASPSNLNDPFDASLPFRYNPEEMTADNITKKLLITGRQKWRDISEEELHERAYQEQSSGIFDDDSYWKEQHDKIKENLHKTFGVLSLTGEKDNLLMWAHYANCHRGFCVGLNSCVLFNALGGQIGDVRYQEDFPYIPMFANPGEEPYTMIEMLNTKSPHWNYEKEYRLSKHDASNRAFNLPPEAITEIVLGCNVQQEDKMAIIDLIAVKLPHVKIFQARTSLERFELEMDSVKLM